jgi:primosomal protein DnaI
MEPLSEALAHWRKLSFADRAAERIRELLDDPLVRQLRADHPEIDDRTLKLNMNRLYQYVKEHRQCANCPGLERCPNDFEGHYTMLSVETINGIVHIHDRKAACRKQLAKQAQDAIRSRIRSFYIDDRALTHGYSIDEIVDIDPERVEAVGTLLKYIRKTQSEGLQKEGLYLVGRFGTGKTFLMCFMLYQLAKSGYSGVIVYMPDFVEDLKSMIQEPQRLKETVELLKETDLLVFDDIGAENLSPWVRDHVMGTILNYRMNRKPTFFTSNHEPDELEKHFSFTSKDGDEEYKGQRIMDRIRPFVEVVVVNGTNKRGKAGA